jgi:hypothetical protein
VGIKFAVLFHFENSFDTAWKIDRVAIGNCNVCFGRNSAPFGCGLLSKGHRSVFGGTIDFDLDDVASKRRIFHIKETARVFDFKMEAWQ